MSEPLFNEDILDFKFLPNNSEMTESIFNQYQNLPGGGRTKKSTLIRYLHEGIRLNPNEEGTFLCVICNVNLSNNDEVSDHIENAHKEPLELLRNTTRKPVVGVDLIIEYRNDKGDIIEYECNLCCLSFNKQTVFWHVISYPHKERFFKAKFSTDAICQLTDPNVKHEKIDQALINYEKSKPDRGRFLYRRFENGMIESVSHIQSKLNMTYIRKMYPTEKVKLDQLYEREEKIITPLKNSLDIKIENNEHFQQGKAVLQKMNKALIEYFNTCPTRQPHN